MLFLSSQFLLEVEKSLTNSMFGFDDFVLTSVKYNDYVKLTILYKYNNKFNFVTNIYNSGDRFSISLIPGAIIENESFSNVNKITFLSTIRLWIGNIKAELSGSPIARKVMENEEAIREIQNNIGKVVKNGESYFSFEEGEALKERLENLKNAFTSQLQEDIKNEKKLDEEVTKLKAEVELLKMQVEGLTRKNWLLAFTAKMYNWGKRNPQTIKKLGSFTRELLPSEIKDSLPNDALDILLDSPDSVKK